MQLCVESGVKTQIYYSAEHEESSSKAARRAVATRPFESGEIVFENQPFMGVFAVRERQTRCSHCFAKKLELSSCAKCKIARYCNATCQQRDWKIGHKHECKHIKDLVTKGCAETAIDEILLVIRTHNRVLKSKKSVQEEFTRECSADTCGIVACGCLHVEDLCDEGSASYITGDVAVATVTDAVRRLADKREDIQGLLAPISRLYASFRTNNFGIVSELMVPIGSGVYPHAALLNHSCHPNGLLGYRFTPGCAPTVYCIALRNLKVGEELTHCYIDATLPTQRRDLRAGYGFDCTCKRCVAGNTMTVTSVPLNIDHLVQALRNAAHSPVAVRDILGRIPPSERDVLQYVVDSLQSRGTKPTDPTMTRAVLGLQVIAAETKRICYSSEDVPSMKELDTVVVKFSRALDEMSTVMPFNAQAYEAKAQMFTMLLPYSVQEPPEADIAMLTVRLCAEMCSYLTLTLHSFHFHPLLALQLATLGQLSQDRAVLHWSYDDLLSCFANDNSGGKAELLSGVLEQLNDL
jgi:hypothetical protein